MLLVKQAVLLVEKPSVMFIVHVLRVVERF